MSESVHRLQLWLGPEEANLERVVDVLRSTAGEVDEVALSASADRVVRLSTVSPGGWLGIEDVDLSRPEWRGPAAALSRLVPVVTVDLADDTLVLGLWVEGGQQDDDAAGWARVLPGVDPSTLDAARRADGRSPHDVLDDTAVALGWDGWRSRMAGSEFAVAQVLRFRYRDRTRVVRAADGPPGLRVRSADGAVRTMRGERWSAFVQAVSVGRSGPGPVVAVSGSALSKGLVTVTSIEVVMEDGTGGPVVRESLSPIEAPGPTLYIAPWHRRLPAGREPKPGAAWFAVPPAAWDPSIGVNLTGTGLRLGKGELRVRLLPGPLPRERDLATVPLEGATEVTLRMFVEEPLRQPLRFVQRAHGNSGHLLRPLAGRSQLRALLVLNEAMAVESVVPWCDELAASSVEVWIHPWEPTPRVSPRRGPLDDRVLRGALVDSQLVVLRSDVSAVAFSWGPRRLPHGASYVPALAVATSDLTLQDQWRERIDDALARGALLQASLFRTASIYRVDGSSTDYEIACGIDGQVTQLRSWCERYVRIPGELGIWMSAPLAGHLDAEAWQRISSIATVHVGPFGRRVVLREPDDLDAFENALGALLPTAEDSRSVIAQAASRDANDPRGPT